MMNDTISPGQRKLIGDLSDRMGRTADGTSKEMHGKGADELTRSEASLLIDRLIEISNALAEERREYKGSKEGGWVRCNASRPCQVCGKKKYCCQTSDGKFALCTKVSSGAWAEAKNGHYIHKLLGAAYADTTLRPARVIKSAPRPSADEIERRVTHFHAVYSTLLELSPAGSSELLVHGRKGLAERGLADDADSYGLLPAPYVDRLRLTEKIIERLNQTRPLPGVDDYRQLVLDTPGFWLDPYRQPTIWFDENLSADLLVIPYLDHLGRIQGCQIRDPSAPPDRRYQWLSSTPFSENGPSPGTPIHYVQGTLDPQGRPKKNLITEGRLKGDAAGKFLRAYAITTTTGVTCSHAELIAAAQLITAGKLPVVIAFDKDHVKNDKVCRQIARLIAGLINAGLECLVLIWSSDEKGVDDALLSPQLPDTTFSLLPPPDWLKSLSRKVKEEAVKALLDIGDREHPLRSTALSLHEKYEAERRARDESKRAQEDGAMRAA